MRLRLFIALLTSFVSLYAQAMSGANCYTSLDNPQEIQGDNINERLPLASTSKLITSYWAIKEKGIDYRFATVFYFTQVGRDLYDLHIQGSRDPFFGAERAHYTISELNKRGIKHIRNLTFDENFKFYWSVDDPKRNNSVAEGFYVPQDPVPRKVMLQLRAFSTLLKGYKETYYKAAKIGVKMVKKPVFTIQDIEFQSDEDFKKTQNPADHIYVVNSTPLSSLLKEMNRNSNNYAANQIFEHMESEEKFSQFIEKDMNLDMHSVVMFNGSGDRYDLSDGAHYNEATCSAMLKILINLHKTLLDQHSSFSKIATVIGTNSGTPTSLYTNDKTYDSVVAKTGTVNPAVTLAGVASTKKGLIFFMFNEKTNGTARSWNNARYIIRKKLTQLMSQFNGGVRMKAKSFSFVSFDNLSFSDLVDSSGEILQ